MPRVRRRRAKRDAPHVSTASTMLTSDAILAAPSIPPCNTTLPSPRIVPVESTSTLTSGALAQYTTGRNAGPNLLVTQDLCALLQSTVLESASFPLASSVTSALGSSAVGKVTALPVQPLISAPISESSRVEATRSGLNFLSPNHHGCVYAPMALNWLRVVGSLLRWRRMVGILKRQNWSDGWHGMCGKFEGARLLWSFGAADLGIRSGSRCIQSDALGTGSSYNVTAELGDELAFGGGVDEGIDFMFEDFDQCDACGFDCDY